MDPLRIGLVYDPVMATECACDTSCSTRGAGVDAAEIVCQYLKINCSFEWAADRNDYGIKLPNGSWTGMIGDVSQGRFDTSIPYFFPTDERFQAVDFSSPYFYVQQVFVTRTPSEQETLNWGMVLAFDWPLWCCIFVTCCTIGLFVRVTESQHSDAWWAFFDAFKYITGHGEPYRPYRSKSLNLLFTVWALASIVVSGTYTGVMFYRKISLKNLLPFVDVSSFADCLIEGRCRFVHSPRQDYLLRRLTASNGDQDSIRLALAFRANPPLVVDDVWRVIVSDQTVFWTTIDVKFYFLRETDSNHKCSYYWVLAPFNDMASFPLPKHASYRAQLDSVAQLFQDDGLALALMKKYSPRDDNCQQISGHSPNEPLSLTSMRSFCVLFAAGLTVSISVLFIEICKAHTQHVPRTPVRRLSLKSVSFAKM